MRIYGVYEFSNHSDWNILLVDILDDYIVGLAFSKNGDFETKVVMTKKGMGDCKQIGYIYNPITPVLKLNL